MLQIIFEFIFKFTAPYGIPTFACARWIARLHYETFYISMEQRTIVVVAGAQSQKVFARFRAIVAEQFDFNVANVRVQCHRLKNQHKTN